MDEASSAGAADGALEHILKFWVVFASIRFGFFVSSLFKLFTTPDKFFVLVVLSDSELQRGSGLGWMALPSTCH